MTAEILSFVPQHELTAAENMVEFVRLCRYDLKLYEPNFDWEENYWPEGRITFGNIDQRSARSELQHILAQPFLDFAKAYFRYRHTHAPNEHRAEMRALKCVERALIKLTGGADPAAINITVLDEAAQIARNQYTAAYPPGRELEVLANFLTKHRLVGRPLHWVNPIGRPTDTVRTGIEAKARRERKLPRQDALDAIAEIFARGPTDPDDIFVTSTVAMLLCAPSRISEILELPVDCEVEEKKRDGSLAYGWRFRPKKGGSPMIKWIPSSMVDIAKEAIARLREITQPARDLAIWAEREDTVSSSDLVSFLGRRPTLSREDVVSLVGEIALDGLPFRYVAGEEVVAALDFMSWVGYTIRREHRNFPLIAKDSPLHWSEALFCFHRNQLNKVRRTIPLSIWAPNNNALNDRLGAKPGLGFFERHGFNDGRDAPFKITSHQFRHLIVTIAHQGGLSNQDLARWRGSNDVRQNRAYDQRSEFELVAMLREHDPALIRGKSEIEIAEQIKVALPVTTAEFNALEKPTAHITELGFCIHDFVMSPCQRFRDCLNCTEQICVKGDRRLQQLQIKLELVEEQLDRAMEGAAEGLYGADPWTHIQMQTRDRLRNLIEIMEDPTISDGTIVRLANPGEFSPARRALRVHGHDQTYAVAQQASLPDPERIQ